MGDEFMTEARMRSLRLLQQPSSIKVHELADGVDPRRREHTA